MYRTIHRRHEAGLAEGLGHVVHGVDLEGTLSIFAVRRHEDDAARHVVAQRFEHAEAVTVGHLDVEK